MTPIATEIYNVLRSRVPTFGDPRLSYSMLVASLPATVEQVSLESPEGSNKVMKALQEVVDHCKLLNLPCIVALVVQSIKGRLEYPGKGYYAALYPDAKSKEEQIALWGREFEAVKKTTYPELA